MKKILAKLAFLLTVSLPAAAFAEDVQLYNPLGKEAEFSAVLRQVLIWFSTLAGTIVAIMVVIGAFQMLFAGGSPEKFKTGQKTILYAAIGFVIILMANGIAAIVKGVLVTS